MTAKEKAKELFTNYLILFPEFYNDLEYGYNDVKAKQCALIAVDEILWMASHYVTIQFWENVKIEIEKL
jgi:hypothetical protein